MKTSILLVLVAVLALTLVPIFSASASYGYGGGMMGGNWGGWGSQEWRAGMMSNNPVGARVLDWVQRVGWWLGPLLVLLALWSVAWKGYALWLAAQDRSKVWFVVLLLVNTVGILDILYIYLFRRAGKKA